MNKTTSSDQKVYGKDCIEKNYHIVGVHLKKAYQSNELAENLMQKGFADAAQKQSGLTKVYISNALHLINHRY